MYLLHHSRLTPPPYLPIQMVHPASSSIVSPPVFAHPYWPIPMVHPASSRIIQDRPSPCICQSRWSIQHHPESSLPPYLPIQMVHPATSRIFLFSISDPAEGYIGVVHGGPLRTKQKRTPTPTYHSRWLSQKTHTSSHTHNVPFTVHDLYYSTDIILP